MRGKRCFTLNQEREICRIYSDQKLSTLKIAKQLNCRVSTLWTILKRNGVKLRSNSEANTGVLNPNWKGGRRICGGYVLIKMPNHPYCDMKNYVLEHRLIMEKHLGRFLTQQEVIHHVNGNIQDNRIENLRLFVDDIEHRQWHKLQRKETKHLQADFLRE